MGVGGGEVETDLEGVGLARLIFRSYVDKEILKRKMINYMFLEEFFPPLFKPYTKFRL